MSLKDDIAAARAALEAVEPVTQEVEVGGKLHTLSFLPAGGQVWADLVAMHPPREGSKIDSDFGFNADAVGRAYPVELISDDGEPVAAEDWQDMFAVLSSPNIKNIGTAVWGINQFVPAVKLAQLKKASAGDSKKKSSSPAK